MNKIRKILVPLDFSENSRVALDWAMSIANKLGAKVILFHAMETSDFIKELAEQEDDVLSRVKSGAAISRLKIVQQVFNIVLRAESVIV
ncbi:universal stress protein [candidate division KSB1 bacterium]|nr:universal stress protein [candidate division KSB1 bacterium]